MKEYINDVELNYIRYGNINKDTIVLLHGWGQNIEMMKPVGDNLQNDFDIIIVDLPGFGNSSEPKNVFSVYDYAECIHELLMRLRVFNPIVIGHSFGGKISLCYAGKYEVKKLVLFASPYKPEIEKISIKTKILKLLAKIPFLSKFANKAKKYFGSTDYKNASEMMRNVLVSTVNTDITEDIKKIKCSTLLVWGTNDTAVPLKRAYEIQNLINDAGVVEYPNCTHYAYLENLEQTIKVLESFLK